MRFRTRLRINTKSKQNTVLLTRYTDEALCSGHLGIDFLYKFNFEVS